VLFPNHSGINADVFMEDFMASDILNEVISVIYRYQYYMPKIKMRE
jgi:hypothetical protein